MTNTKRFTEAEHSDAKAWDLPFIDDPQKAERDADKTNALNKRSNWKYEPPEEEEEVLPPTAEEIEAIRQAAHEEGYQEGFQKGHKEGHRQGSEAGHEEGQQQGYDEGYQKGLETGQNVADERAGQWQALLDTLHDPLSQVNLETREQLVKLAVSLAKSVIRTEVKSSEDVIMQALSEGMKVLPVNETQYRIQMHPDDIELVKNHLGDEDIAAKGWQFVESPAMARGGCDIATTQNAVDVSIERRSRDVLEKFLMDQGIRDD
ncbi:flagellar assembly protein FliH [Alteromonas halophila]|uniref:Flagellar assembly protein FliH n=1 Tax=Alteromonas halophila TaxID=516698 RepID=A0A918MUE8_9ALTE|nr:flagellar assembly protein FliH [Alteromonas halophila]GGW73621.1 flagellar assembly protein FliH [Alteromonas halophila]